jgi:hypothetical protein
MGNASFTLNKKFDYWVWGKVHGTSFEFDKAIGFDDWFANHSQSQWFNVPLNSEGFRSDEFTNKHEGIHIIFSGDSNTFGMGLEKEEMWSYLTYQEISKNVKTSGYFNLGSPGSSIMTCILNIFKYCKKYGNPDAIFINLTEIARFYDYIEELDSYSTVFYDGDNKKRVIRQIRKVVFDYYLMLEQYCKSNDIQLYSFTWDVEDNKDGLTFCTNNIMYLFDTFYRTKGLVEMWEDMISSLDENTIKSKYFQYARDGSHFGIGPNKWWANKMIQLYNTKNNVNGC